MRLLALSILVLATSCASDGPLGPAGSGFRDFQKVNKRRDLDPQTCVDNFDIHRDKIIRTEDSKEMGAKYLNEIDLGSRDECLRLCCETETCDVFVFEEKSPGSCYLFHCGPPEDFKCKFTRHTNFSSAVLAVNRHLAELEDQIKLTKHEQDLASLRKQYQDVVTTAKPTTPHSVQIQVHETVPPVTITRRCSRYQFECHSSEECIAIYNACDGIPQCADGSDEAPELGCPATTTLTSPPAPPVNLPPRELLPHLPQMQSLPAYMPGAPETIPQKEMPPQHPPAFMSPILTQDGAAWPRRLEQLPQPQVPHLKQYSDTLGGSHIFNHKGGLQVTEADSISGPQYEYKPLPYDPMPDNSWQHRSWQQPQADAGNMNDGSQMYHMDMDNQNSWKQQQNLQSLQMQSRLQSNQNLPQQRMQSEKMGIQGMPNLFQDRDKMWAVPQLPNVQENQPVYTQTKIISQPEEPFEKPKPPQVKEAPHITEKVIESDETEEETTEESKEKVKVEQPEVKETEKHKESKTSKKHSSTNKTKKKHLKPESDDDKDDESKLEVKGETVMIKLFEEDVHDGAAERPPGAILLLTLGVCMTSIMIVLLGCRLKMAKRRMRRMGKSSFAHDADYLVNGMYL